MECLKIELLVALEGHKAHGRALHRLGDCLSIAIVILVALQKRLDIFRWHQTNIVPKRRELAANVMGSGAGLHADEAGQNICQTFWQGGARQSFTQNDCPLGVHSADMKGVFPDIDADVRDDDIRIADHDGVLQMS